LAAVLALLLSLTAFAGTFAAAPRSEFTNVQARPA
jgi:hypothetical protein